MTTPHRQPKEQAMSETAISDARVEALAVCRPGQCCDGWCVDDIGLHGASSEDAHYIANAVRSLLAEAADERAEQIAQAIEAEREGIVGGTNWYDGCRAGLTEAARIAREATS